MGDGWWGFVADDLASGVLVKVLDLALPGYGFYPVYASDHPDALSWIIRRMDFRGGTAFCRGNSRQQSRARISWKRRSK